MRNTVELQALQITTIVRETGVMVYVNLPVKVMEMETPELDVSRGGTTLREIVVKDAVSQGSPAADIPDKADMPMPNTRKKGRARV